jgi:heme-degrading monooxygenase HmoA
MFIAMNRFKVNPDRAEEFEQRWKSRESYLHGQKGFVRFALLRGDEPGDFISHSTWTSRAAFLSWAQSEHFRQAHNQPMPDGLILDHPRASFYEAVVVEEASASRPAKA